MPNLMIYDNFLSAWWVPVDYIPQRCCRGKTGKTSVLPGFSKIERSNRCSYLAWACMPSRRRCSTQQDKWKRELHSVDLNVPGFTVKSWTVDCLVSSTFSFRLYEGKLLCLCTVTFGWKSSKVNGRPVYCLWHYGIIINYNRRSKTAKSFFYVKNRPNPSQLFFHWWI